MINPFQERVKAERRPEAVQEAEIGIAEAVENAVKKYLGFKETMICGHKIWGDYYKQFSDLEIGLLTPMQIELVFSKIIKTEGSDLTGKHASFYPLISLYLTDLIQKSYGAGNNDFFLSTKDFQFGLSKIKGTKAKPLHATIIGNILSLGNKSEYCIFDIQGDVGERCGDSALSCTYNILGNVGDECGVKSNDCNYNISGNAGNNCGRNSRNSTYNIDGNTGEYLAADSIKCSYTVKGKIKSVNHAVVLSTFNMMDEKSYGLLKCLHDTNTTRLLDKAGKTIKEKTEWRPLY